MDEQTPKHILSIRLRNILHFIVGYFAIVGLIVLFTLKKNRGFFLSCLVTYWYTCGILLTEHWMPEREDLVWKNFCLYV
jgi:hypothetical protein